MLRKGLFKRSSANFAIGILNYEMFNVQSSSNQIGCEFKSAFQRNSFTNTADKKFCNHRNVAKIGKRENDHWLLIWKAFLLTMNALLLTLQ